MKRAATRYKGVWDAGFEAGMAEANRLLCASIDAGVAFAPGRGFDVDTVALRRADRITFVPRESAVQLLHLALRRTG